MISMDSIVTQQPGHLVSDMDGEKVMLSITNGKYYNLGSLGGEIWELIETATVVSSLVDTLLSRYEVDRAMCEEHVLSFLEMLAQENLLVVNV